MIVHQVRFSHGGKDIPGQQQVAEVKERKPPEQMQSATDGQAGGVTHRPFSL